MSRLEFHYLDFSLSLEYLTTYPPNIHYLLIFLKHINTFISGLHFYFFWSLYLYQLSVPPDRLTFYSQHGYSEYQSLLSSQHNWFHHFLSFTSTWPWELHTKNNPMISPLDLQTYVAKHNAAIMWIRSNFNAFHLNPSWVHSVMKKIFPYTSSAFAVIFLCGYTFLNF